MATTITGTTIDVGPNKLVANSAGNVGVGTASPETKLTIDSDISTTYSATGYAATLANSMMYLNNTNGGSNTASLINFRTGTGDGLLGFVAGSTNVCDFVVATDGGSNGVERLRITNDGRGLSEFTAKAWCKWASQGTSSNLTYGHNVSSVSYVATGHWRINYTNSLTYNYSATMMVSDNGGRNTTFKVGEFEQAYCGVFISNMSQVGTTSAIACFTAFGE